MPGSVKFGCTKGHFYDPNQKIITFRNKNRNRIAAFNTELVNSIDSIQQEVTAAAFVERFNNIYSELTTEVITQGLGVIAPI